VSEGPTAFAQGELAATTHRRAGRTNRSAGWGDVTAPLPARGCTRQRCGPPLPHVLKSVLTCTDACASLSASVRARYPGRRGGPPARGRAPAAPRAQIGIDLHRFLCFAQRERASAVPRPTGRSARTGERHGTRGVRGRTEGAGGGRGGEGRVCRARAGWAGRMGGAVTVWQRGAPRVALLGVAARRPRLG